MKLSKEELIYLLRGVGTEWGSIEDVSRAEHVIDALKTNRLEIEGYERVPAWIKFDPNDPKTFPPIATPVLFCEICFDARDRELRKIISAGWHNPQNHLFWKGQIPVKHEDVTHWRPLPETPKEMEEAK